MHEGVLLIMALDQCRFGSLTRKPTLEEAKQRSLADQLDFLKRLVRKDKHPQLGQHIQAGGLISAVRFRVVHNTIEKISQAELRYLWNTGEAIVACTTQPDWDLLVPLRKGRMYSVIVVQVKNHVHGPERSAGYRSATAFPTLVEAPSTQSVLLCLELHGKRRNTDSSTTAILPLYSPHPSTRQVGEKAPHVCVGNWGATGKTAETAAAVFPALREEPGGKRGHSFMERNLTTEKEAILQRSFPPGNIS